MRKIITTGLVALTALAAFTACDTGDSYAKASDKGTHAKSSDSKSSKPAAPKMTTGQSQALSSAKSYLTMGGFSRAGLIGQLHSQAGEGFKLADAVWAVNHTDADWNAQAVLSAKSYMKMGGFSRSALIDQLSSSAGEQFTRAQAEYAAKRVGY